MHYYDFNVADYRKDTHHLEPLEHYIYRFLMDSYYLNEKPIPNETQSVLRRLRRGSDHLKLLENVLNDFFYLADDGWHHKRIDSEIEAYQARCAKNAKNGKKGGRPKKQQLSAENKPKKTQSVSDGLPDESQKKPNQEPITNNHKPIKNIVEQARHCIDHLNEVCGTSFQHVPSNTSLVTARIKEGHTVDDIKSVIDSKHKDWAGTDQQQYLRPKTLFSAQNFNNYIGQVGITKPSKSKFETMSESQLCAEYEKRGWDSRGVRDRFQMIQRLEAAA